MLALDPYELLGVPRTATADEITLAYTRLSAVFDPDRWAASPSLAEQATEWSTAIDEARRTILAR
jgi:curved DNA-binding protein CbpA